MTKKGPAWSLPGATALPGLKMVSAWHSSELHPGLCKAGFVLLPPGCPRTASPCRHRRGETNYPEWR